jgi:hypothetical protein
LKNADLMAQSEKSNWSAARLRNEAPNAAKKAVNKYPKGNPTMSGNSHCINAIGIYESHSPATGRGGNAFDRAGCARRQALI